LKPKENVGCRRSGHPARNNLLRGVNLGEVTLRDELELPDALVQRSWEATCWNDFVCVAKTETFEWR